MAQQLAVVMPVYSTLENSRITHSRDTIESALAQDYDFLLLIVDDGSTDKTYDFLKSIKDSRVMVVRRERKPSDLETASNALNMGFQKALEMNCECFAYLGSDDLLPEGSLEIRVDALGDASMVYGRKIIVIGDSIRGHAGFERDDPLDPRNLQKGFPHQTSMWRRDMFEKMVNMRNGLLFDPSIFYGEDIDVTLFSRRLIEDGMFKSGFVDAYVYACKIHEHTISCAVDEYQKEVQIGLAYEKNGYHYSPQPLSLVAKNLRRPGHFLPEWLKSYFRPIAVLFKNHSCGFLFSATKIQEKHTELPDPYWFRTKYA